MDSQTSLFQILKPPCVALNDAALSFQTGKSSAKQLVGQLEALSQALQSLCKSSRSDQLNANVSEYVFFPLSHVFRQRRVIPIRALESALQCLQVLLKTGWRKDIAPERGMQLVGLLPLIAGNSDGQIDFSKITEELLAVDFMCLFVTIDSLVSSKEGRSTLISNDNLPTVGHAIMVSLEALLGSESKVGGLSALDAIQSFTNGLSREVLASFLPGIVSTLTKVLTPSASARRPFQILESCLRLMTKLFERVFHDDFEFNSSHSSSASTKDVAIPELNQSWLTATASQIKLALTNVIKIRKHDRVEIRQALQTLCMFVLQKCQKNLPEILPMMFDTLLTISADDSSEELDPRLSFLVFENSDYTELVKSSLHNQFLSLPRAMISNDSSTKQSISSQINTSVNLLHEAGVNIGVTTDLILSSLRDAWIGTVQNASQISQHKHSTMQELALSGQSSSSLIIEKNKKFPQLLSVDKANKDNAALLRSIIVNLSASEESLDIVRMCLDQLSSAVADGSLADFWIALLILRERRSSTLDVDEFLDLDVVSPHESMMRQELYAISVSMITRSEDDAGTEEPDWRLQALALESISFYASILQKSFRPELSDILYPILHFLGSPVPLLRSHAIIALNQLAYSTGYSSPQELIIRNNDYLINGISLKLSTFDLSPQAPQVLNMLVRLCGSELLPYLDDVTDSIFDALECFYGYDGLVGLLFQCLGSMVEKGVQAPALLIEDITTPSHSLPPVQPPSITEIARLLQERAAERSEASDQGGTDGETISNLPPQTPHQYWKKVDSSVEESTEEDAPAQASTSEEKLPPLSKAYHLIHRITLLIQHHIPSGNPFIRSHLFHVLCTALPYLAHHEDTFLPLIHTLWPVLVPRLQDSEASVVAGALNAMEKMAEGAGGFMRGRVADIWTDIRRLHRRAMTDLSSNTEFMQAQEKSIAPPSDRRAPKRLLSQKKLSSITGPETERSIIDQSQPSQALDLRLEPSSTRALAPTTPSTSQTTAGSDVIYLEGRYIPTTALRLRRSLTSFLVSLIQCVEIPTRMFDEILSNMLSPYLLASPTEAPWIVEDERRQVKTALEQRNSDAVWLIMLRNGQLQSEKTHLESITPEDVDGGPTFAQYVEVC